MTIGQKASKSFIGGGSSTDFCIHIRRFIAGHAAGFFALFLILAFLISYERVAWAQTPTGGVFAQHDVRGRSEDGILAASVSSSMQTVSLIVRTADQTVWPVAFQTARAFSQEGYPVSFVLAGNGPDELAIYARGVAISRIRNPGTSQEAANAIRTEMLRAYDLVFAGE